MAQLHPLVKYKWAATCVSVMSCQRSHRKVATAEKFKTVFNPLILVPFVGYKSCLANGAFYKERILIIVILSYPIKYLYIDLEAYSRYRTAVLRVFFFNCSMIGSEVHLIEQSRLNITEFPLGYLYAEGLPLLCNICSVWNILLESSSLSHWGILCYLGLKYPLPQCCSHCEYKICLRMVSQLNAIFYRF